MKQDKIRKLVSDLQVEIMETPAHKETLRQSLTALADSERTSSTWQLPPSILDKYRGVFMKNRSMKFTIVPLGLVLFVAVLSLAIVGPSTLSSNASAVEQLEESQAALSKMTQEERKEINQLFLGSPEAALEEAKNAKDVKTLSREEYEEYVHEAYQSEGESSGAPIAETTTDGSDPSFGPSGQINTAPYYMDDVSEGTAGAEAFGNLNNTFSAIKYTNPQRQVVVLLFDEQDRPLFRTVVES